MNAPTLLYYQNTNLTQLPLISPTFAQQKIGIECQRFRHSWNEAKKPQNKPLNRYRDVNPFDHTRVVLKRCERDYINANYVTVSAFQNSLVGLFIRWQKFNKGLCFLKQ